jgi:hypothetical protein
MLFPKHESRTSTQQPCDRVYVCSVHAHCLPYCHLKLHCRAFVISFRHYRVLMGVPTDHDLRCSQESSSYTCKVNKAPEPTSFCISFTSIVCSSPCRAFHFQTTGCNHKRKPELHPHAPRVACNRKLTPKMRFHDLEPSTAAPKLTQESHTQKKLWDHNARMILMYSRNMQRHTCRCNAHSREYMRRSFCFEYTEVS